MPSPTTETTYYREYGGVQRSFLEHEILVQTNGQSNTQEILWNFSTNPWRKKSIGILAQFQQSSIAMFQDINYPSKQ